MVLIVVGVGKRGIKRHITMKLSERLCSEFGGTLLSLSLVEGHFGFENVGEVSS